MSSHEAQGLIDIRLTVPHSTMGAPVRLAKSIASLKDATTLYGSIRALVAKQDYAAALDAGWNLYYLLCGSAAGKQLEAVPRSAVEASRPPLGKPPQSAQAQQRATLVVGAVLNLLRSAVKVPAAALPATQLAATLDALLQPLAALPAWLK